MAPQSRWRERRKGTVAGRLAALTRGVTRNFIHGSEGTAGTATAASPSWGRNLFKYVIDIVIILNVVQMGMAVDFRNGHWSRTWIIFELVVTVAFTLELCLNLWLQRIRYWRELLNLVDFVIVCASVADVFLAQVVGVNSDFKLLQILRLMRLLRMVKLLKLIPEFMVILEGIGASMKTMAWFILLLGIIMYLCAIICTQFLGREDTGYPAWSDDAETLKSAEMLAWNNYKYFGTMGRSMVTLFNIVLLAEISPVLRPIWEMQPWALLFFVALILLVTFGILNAIIGVIVEKTISAMRQLDKLNQARHKEVQMDIVEELAQAMFELDQDGDNRLSVNEMNSCGARGLFQRLLKGIDVPIGFTTEDLHTMLDADGSGCLTIHEFIGGMFQLIFSNDFQRDCLLQLSNGQLKTQVRLLSEEIQNMRSEIDMHFQDLQAEVQRLRHTAPMESPKERLKTVWRGHPSSFFPTADDHPTAHSVSNRTAHEKSNHAHVPILSEKGSLMLLLATQRSRKAPKTNLDSMLRWKMCYRARLQSQRSPGE